ncbi:CDP-alcohol phosphatidyltransferase family protein [Portibacter marinus]|uniref:CDP-alcohol phosphatidyltransferase family protein n=1 Tax=Portibacter marinus TaxID=2898660 RepID=UPI001F228FAC|nr:CDP-alcohol phosphatidyltransferase family protein [Portibacter marinus]
MKNKLVLPYALIIFRLLCAPAMLIMGYFGGTNYAFWIVLLLYLGLISDILDGIVARNAGVATPFLRRLDSQVDMIFWVSAGWTAWALHSDVIRENWIAIVILFATEALCYLVSFLRFGKETCTHAWLSKFWGITLLAGFTELIGFGTGGFFFKMAIIVGYLSHLDRILITLIIPEWTHDIPSTYHAWLLRKGQTFKRYKIFN